MIGFYVLQAFKNPDKWLSKSSWLNEAFLLNIDADNDIYVDEEVYTARDVVEALREASGQGIEIREYDTEAFKKAKDLPLSYTYELWFKYVNLSKTA